MQNKQDEQPERSKTSPEEPRQVSLLEATWRLFSSMKTAIALLLLLALASTVGTLIPQGSPPEMYVQQYGEAKYAFFRALGFTDVYHSRWYNLILALVAANLFVCSIHRFKLAWARTCRPTAAAHADQVSRMQVSDKVIHRGSVEDTANRAIAALKAGSYKVFQEQSSDDVCLYAAKGRLGIWGPYITHLSILIVLVGAIAGNRLGFEGFTTVVEGEHTTTYYPKGSMEQKDLGFEVRLREFMLEYDANHKPTAYRSDLQVYDAGKPAAAKVIDVNHPLTYEGISFFQSDYGIDSIVLKVTRPDGTAVRIPINMHTHDMDGEKHYVPELEPQQVRTGQQTWTLFVHNFAPDYVEHLGINASFLPINPAAQVFINENFPKEKMAWSPLGWLTSKKPVEYKGHKIELEKVIDYTGLQVSRNPALPVVYVGFAIMLFGVFVALYLPHRVIRVRISPAGDGAEVVVGAVSRSDPSAFERDFNRLKETLR